MASLEEAKEIIKGHPISSIVTMYHPINKKGGNYEGICPFHSDTNPSMKVNDDRGIYKCFVCGAAGDAIKFVQDKHNLDFVESVKDIADKLGITIEEKKGKNRDPKVEMALRVLQSANRLYRKVAEENKPPFYLDFAKKRNLNAETLAEFQIGYAPANNALSSYLNTIPASERKTAVESAASIGIIRPQKYGEGHYDFFRERVVFPIWDHFGKVKGFSSRAVMPDQKPKYLNSGESFVFDKRNIMFGFNFAKKAIREQDSVIIVEGNMDVIMLHQFGFKNSVATMGVALSQNCINVLTNITKNIYLAMDSDPAGIAAMSRINQDFLKLNVIPKFLNFNPAKDPDEFLNEYGRLELVKRIEEADTFLNFQLDNLIPGEIPQRTDLKLDILQQAFSVVQPLGTHLLATEKVIQFAKRLGLKSSDEDIVAEYKTSLTNAKPNYTAPVRTLQTMENQAVESPETPEPADIDWAAVSKNEKIMLETILTHPECVVHEQIFEILDKIQHFEVKRIVQWVRNIYFEIDEADYPLFLSEKKDEVLPEEIKEALNKAIKNYKPTKLEEKISAKMVEDLLIGLEIQSLKAQKADLIHQQKSANTDEEGLEILKQIQVVEEKLLAFKTK